MGRLLRVAVTACVLSISVAAYAEPETTNSTPAPTPDAFIQALSSAYTTHPQLKAEREALRALDENVAQATSGFRPQIGAEYDRGRQRQSVSNTPWGYSDMATKSLKVEQPLFQGGGTLAELKSARARVKAGREQLLSVEQQVLLAAVTAYADLAQAQAVLTLSEHNVEVLGQQRAATQSRFDAGFLTGTDVAQAESRVAAAQAQLTQSKGDVESARATFIRVMGYPPGDVGFPEEHLPSLPATLEEAQLAAQSAFPELRAAQYNEKAADADVDQRVSKLLPSVALVGSVNRNSGPLFPGVNNYENDALTVNVKVPLYQGGGEYSRLRAAKDAREQAKFSAMDTQAATSENTARAWHDYQASVAVIDSTESAVKAADTALTGIREEYNSGTRNTLDVLNTHQELFSRQVDVTRAHRNRIVLAYRLLSAMGKLNAKDLSLPVESYDPIAHYDNVQWLPLGF